MKPTTSSHPLRRIRLPSCILALVLGAAGCFSEDPTTGPNGNGEPVAVIDMTPQLTFEERNVTIKVGETLRWRNTSNFDHTVTADPSKASNPAHVRLPSGAQTFDSGSIGPGATYDRTFTVPGRYDYFCIPHEAAGMLGSITVTQ